MSKGERKNKIMKIGGAHENMGSIVTGGAHENRGSIGHRGSMSVAISLGKIPLVKV
jgi:hypothetical protein